MADKKKADLKKDLSGGALLDTSVLVDGRVLSIAKSGFLPEKIIIPKAVLAELHLISDNKDSLKRQRGRRGLDVVNALRKERSLKILTPAISSKTNLVDKILLSFAKSNKLKLVTLDFNLNKLAKAEGVEVLNINELVEAVKMDLLPGESF